MTRLLVILSCFLLSLNGIGKAAQSVYSGKIILDRAYTDYCADANTVLCMRFNTEFDAYVTDDSGSGNQGVIKGSPVYVSSCQTNEGGCYDYDDAADYVLINDNSLLDITQALTLACWVYVDSTSDTGDVFCPHKYNTSGNQRSYRLFSNNNELFFAVSGSGTGASTTNLTKTNAFSGAATWFHIAGVLEYVDGTNDDMVLYIDGVEVASSSTHDSGIHAGTADLLIGFDGGTAYHGGRLDEVLIMSTALTATQILDIYENGLR